MLDIDGRVSAQHFRLTGWLPTLKAAKQMSMSVCTRFAACIHLVAARRRRDLQVVKQQLGHGSLLDYRAIPAHPA
jgi:hypothetical protein